MKAALLAAALFVPLASAAAEPEQPRAMHDKAWYAAHHEVRLATLRYCTSDESFAHLYDCRNAAAGENMVRAVTIGRSNDLLADPTWWQNNTYARLGAQTVCQRRSGASYSQFAPYCSLVMASQILAAR